MDLIQSLVGDITKEDIQYVDYYISKNLGIFIPSVGFCGYATKVNHSHCSYSFVLLLSDNTIFKTSLKSTKSTYLGAFLSPQIEHEEMKGDNFSRYYALFVANDLFESIYSLYTGQKPFFKKWEPFLISKEIMMLLNQFMSEYEQNIKGSPQILDHLANLIIHYLIRSYLGIETLKSVLTVDENIQRTINYMEQHFQAKITIEILANLANLSESTYKRHFKQVVGQTPINYLIERRLLKAKKLLRADNSSITEVAMKCGFNNNAHLSTTFKKHFGIAPHTYAQQHKKN